MRDADRRVVVPGTAKLPLMRTLWLASTDYFRFFGDVCLLAGPWILLLAVITGAANALKWSWAAWIFERFKAGNLQHAGIYPFISMSLYLVILLLMTLACIDVAVAWHRRILLSERPGWPGGCLAANRGWQYLAPSMLLGCAAVLPAVVVLAAASADFEASLPEFELSPIWTEMIGAGIALAALAMGPALFVRLALVLPARAVDDTDLTLLQSWKATRGSTWRLLVGSGCVIVIPSLFAQFVHYLLGTDPLQQNLGDLFDKEALPKGEWREAASLQLAMALGLLTLPFFIGFLSHSYRHLVGHSPVDAIGGA